MGILDSFKNRKKEHATQNTMEVIKKINNEVVLPPTESVENNKIQENTTTNNVEVENIQNKSLPILVNDKENSNIEPKTKSKDEFKLVEKNKTGKAFFDLNVPNYLYKETVDKKLVIFLIEDSKEMFKYNDRVYTIVKNYSEDSLVCFIHYGDEVKLSNIKLSELILGDTDIKCYNKDGRKVCFYDAISKLYTEVLADYQHSIDYVNKKYRIKDIEIIGIGRCLDNSSKTKRIDAIDRLYRIIDKDFVSIKYFCLNEENVISAATLGFRSIGVIVKKLY